MPLKTVVKVGNITNLSDARYCAGMGVNMLGFQVIPGKANYLSPKDFQEIRGWITGPKIVAEVYGLESPQQLESILTDYRPDLLELSTQELRLLDSKLPLPAILNYPTSEELKQVKFDFVIVKLGHDLKLSSNSPLLLYEYTHSESLETLLNKTDLGGLALSGGSEEKPGLKDFSALADVLESLEVED